MQVLVSYDNIPFAAVDTRRGDAGSLVGPLTDEYGTRIGPELNAHRSGSAPCRRVQAFNGMWTTCVRRLQGACVLEATATGAEGATAPALQARLTSAALRSGPAVGWRRTTPAPDMQQPGRARTSLRRRLGVVSEPLYSHMWRIITAGQASAVELRACCMPTAPGPLPPDAQSDHQPHPRPSAPQPCAALPWLRRHLARCAM